MKRRAAVWLVLVVMILAAVPAAYAVKNGRVEDITIEHTESGITVTMPVGYAEQGFYKLFWKNELTGDVQNAVYPVETLSYHIETEEDAEYSIALFYAKKRGGLPSSWKGDEPKEPQGPSVWKVLWIDAETIEFRGITNHMSEANHRTSEEAAIDFEAYIEELTGGLVDIQVTRIAVDEPVTTLTHYAERGYTLAPDDINVDHYARFSYDSVFVFARMDGIYVTYGGIAFEPEAAMDEPGYSFIPLVGDDCLLQGGNEMIKYVCTHEFIHQLGYLYDKYSLVIPNPDEMVKYGYDPESNDLDPRFFSDALTMKVLADDGKYIGVPAEAWQYKPTHRPVKWNLSYMQDQYGPAKAAMQEEEPAATAEPANPEIYGVIEEYEYENTVMGLKGTFDDYWILYGPGTFPFTMSEGYVTDEDPAFLKDDQSAIVMYARSDERPNDVCLSVDPAAAEFVKENGEEAYWQALKTLYERQSFENGMEDFTCEIIKQNIGDRTLTGLRMLYAPATVQVYTVQVSWINGDYMNMISATSCMSDDIDSILDHFLLQDD